MDTTLLYIKVSLEVVNPVCCNIFISVFFFLFTVDRCRVINNTCLLIVVKIVLKKKMFAGKVTCVVLYLQPMTDVGASVATLCHLVSLNNHVVT